MKDSIISSVILIFFATVLHSQTITWLGKTGPLGAHGVGVSDNGKVVCGWLETSINVVVPFHWTKEVGIQPISSLGYAQVFPKNISADGSTIVGYLNDSYARAFKWTEKTGTVLLDTTTDRWSIALCTNADGSLIGGSKAPQGTVNEACLWTPLGDLQYIDSNEVSKHIVGMSGDGSTLLGRYYRPSSTSAIVWASDRTWTFVPLLSGCTENVPYGISHDGKNVVGYCEGFSGQTYRQYSYLYSASNGIRNLGTLGGTSSVALSVSSGKPIVVGASDGRAYMWTEETSMIDMNQLYVNLLQDNSTLVMASGISADARFIVGTGLNAANNDLEVFLIDRFPSTNGISEDNSTLAQQKAFVITSLLDHIEIHCNNVLIGALEFNLFDLLGNTVLTHYSSYGMSDLPISISTAALHAGLYFFHVQDLYCSRSGTLVIGK